MDILLTLGHNSSAIGIKNGEIIAAYEEERLTRKKSSSEFPLNAIKKIQTLNNEKIERLFISHWYDDFNFYTKKHEKINKNFNYDYINNLKDIEIISLRDEFTHHDAHAYAAFSFLKNHVKNNQILNEKFNIIVTDGFGNKQEVLSIYELNNGKITMIDRFYDYDMSMGLLYQYATSFVGMKENEDEYKFLGYEPLIINILDQNQISVVKDLSKNYVNDYMINLENKKTIPSTISSEYINVEYLMEIKNNYFYKIFEDVILKVFNVENHNEVDNNSKRIVIGHFIQNIIEMIHVELINKYNIKNALVAGGLYYNVKLNNTILKNIDGYFCVIPVSGDQGSALGVYEKFSGETLKFDSLLLGKRNLTDDIIHERVIYVDNIDDLVNVVSEKLKNDEIVQVVANDMEFGPRALCNTSTLALAHKDNVNLINSLNGRNTVMPMAPVMTQSGLEHLFNDELYSRVIGSDEYMIITFDYKQSIIDNEIDKYLGVMHNYPNQNLYSGRPQVIRDKNNYVYKVLKNLEEQIDYKAIINTSYNVHGRPIVYSSKDAVDDFNVQLQKAKDLNLNADKISLVILCTRA